MTRVEYQPGKFLPAYRREAATDNERNEIWIDHGGQTIVCRQIVGILARRIVCRVAAGAEVRAGERFGVMKFGSRMDLFLPPESTLRVAVGDRVRSGGTVMATLAGRPGGQLTWPSHSPLHRRLRNPLRRRTDVEQRRRFRRGVYLLPSLFTMANMFCGYACVVYAMRGEFDDGGAVHRHSPSCSTCSTAASRA